MAQHSPTTSPYGPDFQSPRGTKRRGEDLQLALDLSGLAGGVAGGADVPMELTPHGHHAQPQSIGLQQYGQATPTAPPSASTGIPDQQKYHSHRMPNQPPPSKLPRTSASYGGQSPPSQSQGPPSMVGQAGMPPPAPRPRGPKLKFTPEDDQLLVDLKEKRNLTWKQIAEFFPGRSSGTLQVRYCTKLKAKTTVWTDEMVHKLTHAMQEYENDRWRIIASKVGSGFSPAACKEKAAELAGEQHEAEAEAAEAEEAEEEAEAEEGEESYAQAGSSHLAGSSSDPAASYQ